MSFLNKVSTDFSVFFQEDVILIPNKASTDTYHRLEDISRVSQKSQTNL